MISFQTHQTEEYTLWLCFKDGDLKAFSSIYETYVGILFNYGMHIIRDDHLVKDAIQELFTDLWRNRSNLSPTTSIKYYLLRSLRRKIHLASKEKSLFINISENNSTDFQIDPLETYLTNHKFKEEQLNKLRLAIHNLPERQNEVIRLYFFEGFDFEEISGILEINEQSVRNLLHRSIQKLKQSF